MKELKEVQKFNQWWIWLFGLLPLLMVITEFTAIFANKKHIETEDLIAIALILTILVLSFLWIKMMRLETVLTYETISVHFRGLGFAKRKYNWSEIESAEIVKYDPLWEYGGWGVKYGFNKGCCYNVRGDMGLKLKLHNGGKSLMIGTQVPDQINDFIEVNQLIKKP